MKNKLISINETNKNRLRFKTLDKWLKWQEGLHFTAIELGLERCRRVANNMGLLNSPYNVISVAGTNGKGSSISLLDRILRNAGYKSAVTLHLIYYVITSEFVLMESKLPILSCANLLIVSIELEATFLLHILNLAHLQH